MLNEATKRELRMIIENKAKIVLVHASSGYKYKFLFGFLVDLHLIK